MIFTVEIETSGTTITLGDLRMLVSKCTGLSKNCIVALTSRPSVDRISVIETDDERTES